MKRSMTLMPLKGTTGLQKKTKLRFSHIMSYLLSKHCFPGNMYIFSESNMMSHLIGYHIPLSFNGFSFFSRFYTTIIPSHNYLLISMIFPYHSLSFIQQLQTPKKITDFPTSFPWFSGGFHPSSKRVPSGKRWQKTMENHNFQWVNQLFRLGHFQ